MLHQLKKQDGTDQSLTGLAGMGSPRAVPASPSDIAQTKTWVIAQRSGGKPPDLGDADPVAAQLDPKSALGSLQNPQTSASRGTSSDRFRANFLRKSPGNIGFLGRTRNLLPQERYTNGCSC
jgi:hypothetical protein